MIERWIEVGKRRVRFHEAGSGVPVVFAAGLGLSANFYEPNMRALANAGFRAICPDLPGTGKTRGKLLGASVRDQATHLLGFCRALDLQRCFWIGHSIGCQTVLRIAAQHPEMARAMVLAGPTGGSRQSLASEAFALTVLAVTEPWRLKRAVIRDYVRLSPLNYLGTWIKSKSDDPVAHACASACPILLLIGSRDRVPSRDVLDQMKTLENVRMETLAGGQHGLPLDAQELFDRAAIRFFCDVS